MAIGSSESNHTEGFRKYQPGQYVNAATGWSREYWLSKSVVFSKKFNSSLMIPPEPWLTLRSILQCIKPGVLELHYQREIRRVLAIFPSHALHHLLHLLHSLNPFPTPDQPIPLVLASLPERLPVPRESLHAQRVLEHNRKSLRRRRNKQRRVYHLRASSGDPAVGILCQGHEERCGVVEEWKRRQSRGRRSRWRTWWRDGKR